MRVGLYERGGLLTIAERPMPALLPGGVLMKTLACGLCSGELMTWYMDRKAPHIIGHEVSGRVIESDNSNFPVGTLIAPHHHAPCMQCDLCGRGAYVHCPTWRSTRLDPGGMAEYVAIAKENLADTHIVDGLAPEDSALIEPLACVMKSIRRGGVTSRDRVAVIGAGALGLMHALVLGPATTLFEIHSERRAYAESLGFTVRSEPDHERFTRIFVCPGSVGAMRVAAQIAAPESTIVLFAPLPPTDPLPMEFAEAGYFQDLTLVHSYSCGPTDTLAALECIRARVVRAKNVVSDFVSLDELPRAYKEMRESRIMKAMVLFPDSA